MTDCGPQDFALMLVIICAVAIALLAVVTFVWKFVEVVRFFRRHTLAVKEKEPPKARGKQNTGGPPVWLLLLLIVVCTVAITLLATVLLRL